MEKFFFLKNFENVGKVLDKFVFLKGTSLKNTERVK
jgi:hypothetical protein